MQQLGAKLKALREDRGLRQNHVADCLGISNKLLSSYERNVTVPPVDMIMKLCTFYDISVDELLQTQDDTDGIRGNRLPEHEARFLRYYRKLDKEGRDGILNLMITLSRRQKENPMDI